MINNIIFDCGGVLTNGQFGETVAERLQTLMPDKNVADIRSTFREHQQLLLVGKQTALQFFTKLAVFLDVDVQPEKMMEEFVKAILDNTRMIQFVRSLKRSYKLYLISDNYDHISQALRIRLHGLFIKSYYSNETHILKPDADIFRRVLDENSLIPEETVFIDDKQKNVDGASNLGIHGIHFLSQSQLEEELKVLGVEW